MARRSRANICWDDSGLLPGSADDSLSASQPSNLPEQKNTQNSLGGNAGEIDSLLHSLRISTEGADTKNLGLVSELINETGDDRASIQSGDKVVLIVEDDLRFGKIVIRFD